MTEENAALTEETTLDAQITEAQAVEPVEPTESAPVDAQEEPKEDGFQKRINKVTADKYAEKRRADDLQRKLDEASSKAPSANTATEPRLEDFDYDDATYQAALIDHKVKAAIKAQEDQARKNATARNAEEAQKGFNDRIATLGKEDFNEVAASVPLLPDGVAGALVTAENGAELIYHLGKHLDVADRIASMTPNQAMMELGRVSAQMSAQPQIKASAAPDPIEPISSGGSLQKDHSKMSMEEIYNS